MSTFTKKERKQSEEEIRAHMEKHREEQRRKTQIMHLAYKLETAEPGWTVVIPNHLKAAVEQYIKEKKEQEEYERTHTNDYDDDGYGYCHKEERCRNCGSRSANLFGCCSMGCAKKADRYLY